MSSQAKPRMDKAVYRYLCPKCERILREEVGDISLKLFNVLVKKQPNEYWVRDDCKIIIESDISCECNV